jgi:hypothetical protein
MSIKKVIKQLLQKPLSGVVNYILKMFNVFIVYRIGSAIGDQLCMSAVIRLINEQHFFKIVVISSYPEIFYNNPRIWKCFGVRENGLYLPRILRFLSGAQLENFLFKNDKFSFEEYMRDNNSQLHLVQAHAMHFKINIDFNQISNELYLSELEIKTYTKKFNLPKTFSVIQPNPKKSYTPNKQWGVNNYQEVVTQLKDINWIQVGVDGDLILNDVENYVGITSLRELAFLIKNAEFVLADEGLFNHMASSVGSRSYVVYSGFHPTEISHYDGTISIVNNPQVECAPCWLKVNCPKKIKYCTEEISVNQVINVIKKYYYEVNLYY